MRLNTLRHSISEAAEEDIRANRFAGLVHSLVHSYLNAFEEDLNWGFNVAGEGHEPAILQDMSVILYKGGLDAEQLTPYAPDWYDPKIMEQLVLVFDTPHSGRSGSFGKMTADGRPGISINLMDFEEPTKDIDKRLFQGKYKKTFIHEFTHFLDYMRTHQTRKRIDRTVDIDISSEEGYTEYYSNPAEFNAYYNEAVAQILDWLENEEDQRTRELIFWDGFEGFLSFVMDHLFPPKYQLLPKFDRKIKKRFYKLYTELIEREQARAA